ncbi:endonuclease domain-containing protein [Microtetraspora malaysiensis]|uniref:Endonuclease domain-containing protein n=1 Tax=Microtetraspora malaysiensis TaxID=161358 RepID=A0ABW6SKM4_9ACTN
MIDHHKTCQHVAYRLTCEDFDLLYERAEGKCEICRIPEEQTATGRLDIDHDYDYGYIAVRGLLCRPCNSLLGPAARRSHPRIGHYMRHPFFLLLLQRRHAENVEAARKPRRQSKLVTGVERARYVAERAQAAGRQAS